MEKNVVRHLCNLTIVLGTFVGLPVLAHANVHTFTDDELLDRLSEPEARTLLEGRFSAYSDADKQRIMREHFESAAARPAVTPEEPSAAELLERLNGADSIGGWIKPLVALEKQYRDADEQGKRAIQAEYLAAWDRVPLPDATEQSEGFDHLKLYFVYANNAKKYFQNEAELLAALKSRLLRPELADGELRFLEALSQGGAPGVLGPLSAKYVDEVLTGLETRRRTPEFMQALPDIIEFSYLILGQCDRDGLAVIKRQGKARHGEGISALRYIDVPEAEAMLWEVYESFPPTSRSMRVKVLAALMEKQKRVPEEGRLQRIRAEMVQYLAMPKDKFYLSELRSAAQVAGASRDPYYLPYLEKFKTAIESADLTPAVEYHDYPEGFQHNVDGLNQALVEAKESLVKAKAKAQR